MADPRNPVSSDLSPQTGALNMSLREHGIVFVWPVNSKGRLNGTFEIDGGALITGEMRGNLICRSGSVIITRTGHFIGNIEADRIYVEGIVGHSRFPNGMLIGRNLVSVSSVGSVIANAKSRAFAIHTGQFYGKMEPLES